MVAVRALYSVPVLDRISGTTRWYKKQKRVLCNRLLNKEHILLVECPTLSANHRPSADSLRFFYGDKDRSPRSGSW